ncbi:MAG: cytochrome c oxidase accessory protein CcoG [Tropicimonas sp.]|uniref:cytochrome c oxidase accessory protein CcoG n=1 Tax=Tropicimonas sp. TaxID=2067044 RepID=UPI003A8A374A
MNQPPTGSLYAAREPIFPKRVAGKFRTLKWWILGVTLAIYYITPWIRWDRGPSLPDQAVLVDLAHRRFYFFWIQIWPHEFYFVAGLLIMAGIGLFIFTSALGRVWCGYTCPQTVWTDLFILVERWIEGDRNARVRLWNAPWSAQKARLRITKWAVWLLIALATGGAWIFYFADAPTLLRDFLTFQAPVAAYSTVAVLTATTFIFGGFMREQICIYMCPWPRIQAAMMDPDTLTVAYREWRGEPRGKHLRRRAAAAENAAKTPAETAAGGPTEGRRSPVIPMPGLVAPVAAAPQRDEPGDCIDCNACVNVCPMGIDIRDGQQMACITCALCIDACDEVMTKIGKPRGLIDYLALSDEPRERAGEAPRPIRQHVFRLRTLLYTGIWGVIGLALLWALLVRPDIDVTVSPIRNPLFVTLSDGSIRNAYDIRLRNKHGDDRPFVIALDGDPALTVSVESAEGDRVTVPADQTALHRVYVTAPAGSGPAAAGITDIGFTITEQISGESATADSVFNGRALQ